MNTYFLHPDSIRKLFNSIAPTYDLLNHLLSLGADLYWRKMTVRELNEIEGWVLDMATGTGDVPLEIVRQNGRQAKVFGLDFSERMIQRAYQKILKGGLSNRVLLCLGDAISLPLRDDTFSASVIAFGLRNIPDKEKALSEMVRVTQKGGKVIILEFAFPQKGLMRRLYPIYFKRVLPWVGGVVSGDGGAYAYLPESVVHFPFAEDYEDMVRRSGLEKVKSRRLTFGIAAIISGIKRHQ